MTCKIVLFKIKWDNDELVIIASVIKQMNCSIGPNILLLVIQVPEPLCCNDPMIEVCRTSK